MTKLVNIGVLNDLIKDSGIYIENVKWVTTKRHLFSTEKELMFEINPLVIGTF